MRKAIACPTVLVLSVLGAGFVQAGQKTADCDYYSPTLKVKENYLGSFQFTPGKHTLRLVCVGRNPLSKGRTVGLDSIRLRERWDKKRKPLS